MSRMLYQNNKSFGYFISYLTSESSTMAAYTFRGVPYRCKADMQDAMTRLNLPSLTPAQLQPITAPIGILPFKSDVRQDRVSPWLSSNVTGNKLFYGSGHLTWDGKNWLTENKSIAIVQYQQLTAYSKEDRDAALAKAQSELDSEPKTKRPRDDNDDDNDKSNNTKRAKFSVAGEFDKIASNHHAGFLPVTGGAMSAESFRQVCQTILKTNHPDAAAHFGLNKPVVVNEKLKEINTAISTGNPYGAWSLEKCAEFCRQIDDALALN